MKRILIVINTLGRAGAETAMMTLLNRLVKQDVEISLFVLTGQGEMVHQLPEQVTLLNKNYDDSSVLSAQGQKKLKGKILKAMVRRGTLIRCIPYLVRNLIPMLKARKIMPDKILWKVLSDGAERFDETYDLAIAYLEGGSTYYVADHVKALQKAAFVHVDYGQAGYTRALDKNCYLKLDKIFTVSDEVKTAFVKHYPECEEKTEVFHNILDTDRIKEKAKLFEAFEDDYQGIRLLTVGRLTAQKAFEVSIEAMALLKKQGVKARWYVLGEGDQRKKLEELIHNLHLEEDFILLGAVDNPYPYIRKADIYVHASRFEGKSIAIQEAQVLGRPILVSDCSGNREQVIQNVDGMLCDFTSESICEGIRELIGDPEKRDRLAVAAALKNSADKTDIGKLLSML